MTIPKHRDHWTAVKGDVIDALDVVTEYRLLGVDVPDTNSDGSEWIPCRCYGEEDRTPSAGINVSKGRERGRYKNFKTGENLSFFDFIIEKAGTAKNFFDAIKIYAQKTGVKLPKQKHCSQNIQVKPYVPPLASMWFKAKPPITEESFLRNGGQIVAEKNNTYIGLPVFGTIIDDKNPIGWVVWDRLGKDLSVKDKPVKMKTVAGSDSGMMGLYGLKNIHNAKYIWLTEGPTDLLALDSCLPSDKREEHVIVTHSAGAMERPKEWQLEYFKHKEVIVLSDADTAGIEGAKKWANAIATVAKSAKIVTLPYEKTDSHGKDVRDFLNEGHTFQELIDLADKEKPVEPKPVAGITELGEIDPETGRFVLSENQTLPTANAFIKKYYSVDGFCTLKYQNGVYFSWRNNAYRPVEEDYLSQQVHYFLSEAITQSSIGDKIVSRPFPAKSVTVNQAMDAIQNVAFIPMDITPPYWLGSEPCPVDDPEMMIFCKTHNMDITNKKMFEPTPKWFNFNSLNFDYDSILFSSERWDKFMKDLFGDDMESYQTLMQFIGLLLTPITKFQKALYIVGPKRSGKGTIAKIIHKLIGTDNCCFPTTMGLADRFGLETLIGKTVSITSDARFNKQTTQIAIERILNVTGEDAISIERKFKRTVSMRLPTRMIFLSNELPYFPDSSGAITSRFILLKLTKSFYDNPNINLERELSEELPQILNQAIFWLEQLIKEGRFKQPTSALDDVEIMNDMGSTIGQFVKECCKIDPNGWTANDDLWKAWKNWTEEQGMYLGSKIVFFRNLNSAFPVLKRKIIHDFQQKPFRCYEGITLNPDF
ncbi:MAG: DUF5906 domain-containing protein [Bacteroidales bacterium]|jgi:putative DNA primase/helicase|nr:DUF5906 domain-containing protein [Bacteroidales bacterium]